MFIIDEFDVVVAGDEKKWNNNYYDFYEKFKETVYYAKKETTDTTYIKEKEIKTQTYEEKRITEIIQKYK